MPWAADDVLGLVVVIAVVVIPSLAFTARFALKPIVESMLRIRESLDRGRTPEDPRLAALEERVAAMQETLERVAQAVEFDARLRAGSSSAPLPPSAAGPRLMRPAPQPQRAPAPQPLPNAADFEDEYL